MEDVALVGRTVPYTIIPSTFNPGEKAAFTLRVTSNDAAFEGSVTLKALLIIILCLFRVMIVNLITEKINTTWKLLSSQRGGRA